MIKGKNETTTVPYANLRLLTANYPGLPVAAQPYIYFYFKDARGLEDYYSYTTFSAGRAGTAFVNDYTGNLVFEHADAATTGLRMPILLSSIYNSDITDEYRPGGVGGEVRHGRGWKFSLLQRVQTTTSVGFTGNSTDYPYVYTDADATMHYFYKSGSQYLDEDGLGLELKKLASSFSITDKKANVMTFDASGYLITIKDANANTATISYTAGSHRLSQITDGIGHTLSFNAPLNANSNAYLSTITDPAGRVTTYSNSDGRLTQIKYPDKTVSKYEYDPSGRLYRAISADGTGAEFLYKSDGSVRAVREYGGSATSPLSKAGYTCRFDRSKYNTTVIESPGADGVLAYTDGDPQNADNVFSTLQFDSWGRCVSTIAKTGTTTLGAGTASYSKGAEANATDIAKRNRLNASASLGKNSYNICINPGAESALGAEWNEYLWGSSGTFSFTRTNTEKYQGAYSLKLTSTAMGPSSAARAYQAFTTTEVKGGYSYTFSADVKTTEVAPVISAIDPGAKLCLYAYSPSGNVQVFSEALAGTTDSSIDRGYRRISATLKMPEDISSVRANIMIYGAVGTAYFDNMQLENAVTQNACNLAENASFERGSGTTPTKWTGTGLSSAAGDGISTTYYNLNSKSFKIVGDPATVKEIKQDIVISGSAKDTYLLSGWAKANSVNRSDAYFDMVASVTYASGLTKDRMIASYNPCITDWQYTSGVFVLGTGASSSDLPAKVNVRLRYSKQANNAYFDNIQLIKDSAPTYTYDADGNLISVSANALNNSAMTYSNADLTKYTDAKGYSYTYTYDAKHNMTQAKSQTGVASCYAYVNGNPKTLEIKCPDESMDILTSLTYTPAQGGLSAGGYVSYIYDADGKYEHYTYDQDRGLMLSGADRLGIVTNYTYNTTTDQLTSISSAGTTASYGYADNRLSTVAHNGFTYNLSYDAYGNPLETKVGTQSLSKHAYIGWNGSLASETYGNGDVVQYAYNNYGSVSSIKKGTTSSTPSTKYSWSYDNSGRAWKHTDSVAGITYQYRYDSIGRIISQRAYTTSTGATGYETQYGYDNNNNITKLTNIDAAGTATTTSYVYGKDNLPSQTGLSGTSRKINYSYDTLNRLKDTDITIDSPINLHYNYRVSDRNATGEELYRTTQISSEMIGLRAYGYTYDTKGNLVTVKEGIRTDQATATGTGYVPKLSYQYDTLGQLTRENNAYSNITTTWAYDAGGNITSKKQYAYTTETLGAVQQAYAYVYNSTWKDRLDNYDGQAITYDAIGNPLSYRGFSFGWSSGRQLTSISGNGTASGSFKYGADGLRSSKKISGKTTDYYYVGGKLLAENRDGVCYAYQYDALGRPSRMTYTNSDGSVVTYYLICNSKGDIEEIWTGAGALSARYFYDAYGAVTSVKDATGNEITSASNVANLNPFRYRGYYYDSETGLYYLGSRYYDPETGRFINADGMVQTGQDINDKNMFAYCGNDPVNRADPSGSWWVVNGVIHYDAWELTSGTTVPSTVAAAKAQGGADGAWHAPIKTPTIPKNTPSFTSKNANIDLDGVSAPDGWPNSKTTSFRYYSVRDSRTGEGLSLNAYSVPYIVAQGGSQFKNYIGCVALVWDCSSSQGYYAVVGDVGPPNKVGEVSISLAKKFNSSQGTNYALSGDFIYYIVPRSDIRNTATPETINGMILSAGRGYFGY